ncbi:MAG: RNA methyltransferase [Pseudomonadota bacterium]
MKPNKRVQRGFRVHPDWLEALENVRIVLVGTTHAGNIGGVARVMKNMGLKNLRLVSSTSCGPDTEAFSMSSGAYDVVSNADRFDELHSALLGSVTAVATSARLGGKRTTAKAPSEIVKDLILKSRTSPVSIVFGRESRGLTNEEIKLCDQHVIIPTDANFASMNLAQAVAIMCYEIFEIACQPVGFKAIPFHPARIEDREQMFTHIEQVLIQTGFLPANNSLRMMRDVRRILNSACMDARDVRIIRGIFRKFYNTLRLFSINRLSEADNNESA